MGSPSKKFKISKFANEKYKFNKDVRFPRFSNSMGSRHAKEGAFILLPVVAMSVSSGYGVCSHFGILNKVRIAQAIQSFQPESHFLDLLGMSLHALVFLNISSYFMVSHCSLLNNRLIRWLPLKACGVPTACEVPLRPLSHMFKASVPSQGYDQEMVG